MAASFLEEKKTTLYCLKGKGGKEALKKELEEEGIQAEDGFLCEGALRISGYDSLWRIPAFRQGKCFVQDESSMLAGKVADPKEGQKILDICSAPGGKALYAADKLHGTGQVLARDLTDYKEELLKENIERVGFET